MWLAFLTEYHVDPMSVRAWPAHWATAVFDELEHLARSRAEQARREGA